MQVARVTTKLLVLIRLGFKLLVSFAIPAVLTPSRGWVWKRAEVRAQAKTEWYGTPGGQHKYHSSRPSLPRYDVSRSTQATPAIFPQALNMAVAASVDPGAFRLIHIGPVEGYRTGEPVPTRREARLNPASESAFQEGDHLKSVLRVVQRPK